eukprot:GHVS01011312.1.p1 GENE.GHVS01011312.1~~GHVS01011312.1.p1  ORF type:complete len:110 (+),score=40.85 GHVS01011312.1:59-388(+)
MPRVPPASFHNCGSVRFHANNEADGGYSFSVEDTIGGNSSSMETTTPGSSSSSTNRSGSADIIAVSSNNIDTNITITTTNGNCGGSLSRAKSLLVGGDISASSYRHHHL